VDGHRVEVNWASHPMTGLLSLPREHELPEILKIIKVVPSQLKPRHGQKVVMQRKYYNCNLRLQ